MAAESPYVLNSQIRGDSGYLELVKSVPVPPHDVALAVDFLYHGEPLPYPHADEPYLDYFERCRQAGIQAFSCIDVRVSSGLDLETMDKVIKYKFDFVDSLPHQFFSTRIRGKTISPELSRLGAESVTLQNGYTHKIHVETDSPGYGQLMEDGYLDKLVAAGYSLHSGQLVFGGDRGDRHYGSFSPTTYLIFGDTWLRGRFREASDGATLVVGGLWRPKDEFYRSLVTWFKPYTNYF